MDWNPENFVPIRRTHKQPDASISGKFTNWSSFACPFALVMLLLTYYQTFALVAASILCVAFAQTVVLTSFAADVELRLQDLHEVHFIIFLIYFCIQ